MDVQVSYNETIYVHVGANFILNPGAWAVAGNYLPTYASLGSIAPQGVAGYFSLNA